MELNNKTLEEWLEAAPTYEFPNQGRVNYALRYKSIKEHLNNEIHPLVTPGAMIRDGGFLTDHGPEHIKTVINRASRLVSSRSCELTGYEVYLLLTAIHFHDVGNILGRIRHEINSREIMKHLGLKAGNDSPEKRWIHSIAQAHGGEPKNKIDLLPIEQPIMGQKVRVQLLAAILKFADELADDNTRAARYLLEAGMLPQESEVFHKFAQSLHSVTIDTEGREVKLDFELDDEAATRTYGKGDKQVYLLEEIFERTLKAHLERMYCMRFMAPYIRIDRISVLIEFYDENFEKIIDPIGYRLEEKGYPSKPAGGIYDLCPVDLKGPDEHINWTGEILKEYIEKQMSSR